MQMNKISPIPFCASRAGVEARAESKQAFKVLAENSIIRRALQRRNPADRPEWMVKGEAVQQHRKANKRLAIRQADFEKGSEAQRHDYQKMRWESGGYHRPGSMQK